MRDLETIQSLKKGKNDMDKVIVKIEKSGNRYNAFDKDGKIKDNLFGTNIDNATKHGLVYDLKTDKFIPVKK